MKFEQFRKLKNFGPEMKISQAVHVMYLQEWIQSLLKIVGKLN